MTVFFDTDMINSIADFIGNQFDNGVLELYDGTQPASANDPVASDDVLVASLSIPSPAFGAPEGGTVHNVSQWSGTASTAGTISWFRMKTPDSDPHVIDGSVTEIGNGGDLQFVDTTYADGDTITVDSIKISQPAS